MHQFATGPLGATVPIGSEPPLSPETVGRAPGSSAFLDGPVALKPIPTIPRPGPAPASETPAANAESRRLIVRLLGGEELELKTFDDRQEAMEAAAEIVARLAAAEADGEWPELEGRFLRPGSIASVDVLAVA
jgi:hypothetical protein